MDPGPADERGWHDPSQAFITYTEAKKRGWIPNTDKAHPFWRPAVNRAVDRHLEEMRAKRDAERLGLRSTIPLTPDNQAGW